MIAWKENFGALLLFLQAYLTRRKGNKTLIVYDLELTLHWHGRLAGEEKDVRLCYHGVLRSFVNLRPICRLISPMQQ